MATTSYFTDTQNVTTGRAGSAPVRFQVWAGRALSGIAVLFLALGTVMNLLRVPAAVEGTLKLGYAENVMLPLGIVQVVCLILYLIPRSSVLGVILWTGYLGGAVATHVRLGDTLAHILFPVFFATLLWGGLWLRDRRLRALLPFERDDY